MVSRKTEASVIEGCSIAVGAPRRRSIGNTNFWLSLSRIGRSYKSRERSNRRAVLIGPTGHKCGVESQRRPFLRPEIDDVQDHLAVLLRYTAYKHAEAMPDPMLPGQIDQRRQRRIDGVAHTASETIAAPVAGQNSVIAVAGVNRKPRLAENGLTLKQRLLGALEIGEQCFTLRAGIQRPKRVGISRKVSVEVILTTAERNVL